MTEGFFRVAPVRRYRPPRYPQEGYVIPPRKTRSFWSRLPKEEIIAAVIAGLAPATFMGCMGVSTGGMSGTRVELTEEEALPVLEERFEMRGIGITEDYPFARDGVSFTVDGYDQILRVGYDFMTSSESAVDFDGQSEWTTIDQWHAADGPYFLVLRADQYEAWIEDDASERVARERLVDDLEDDIWDFLNDLEARGVL